MKKVKWLGAITVLSGAALTLTACGNNNNNNASDKKVSFKEAVPKKQVKKGGTLKYAIESDSPFTGIFLPELSDTSTDTEIQGPGLEGLFAVNDTYKINNKGAATFKLDKDAKTITIEVKKGVKWSDGKQVTAKDVEYAYEIVGNPKTKTSRYTDSLANLVGLDEYHKGKADKISGIEMPNGEDGRKVVLHFKEMKPGMLQSGNGYFLESAEPYHYLKDVPFDKLLSDDKVRKQPLFFGPYKVQKVVRGQSVTYVPNEHYWRGKPNLDKVTMEVIGTNSVSQAIKSHKFDVTGVLNTQWNNVKDTKGVNFIGKIPLSYNY